MEPGRAVRQAEQSLTPLRGQAHAGLLGFRGGAVMLTGFEGVFRRSDGVALNVDDLTAMSEGLMVTIRRSKTDQEGQGRNGAPFDSGPPRARLPRERRTAERD